ncbi:MAG: nucleoside hydrolase [bacterium]|nr:nucleoside hydrolase [bacterium]
MILDTDVGDDVDDALALALICASPEVELIGVTTVFGNVAARGRQAQTILQIAGGDFKGVPVAAGCGRTCAMTSLGAGFPRV